jgi:hypothetical protein
MNGEHTRVVTEDEVREALGDLLQPDVIDGWMTGSSPFFGGRRPADLIAAGQGHRVLALIEAMKGGVFL